MWKYDENVYIKGLLKIIVSDDRIVGHYDCRVTYVFMHNNRDEWCVGISTALPTDLVIASQYIELQAKCLLLIGGQKSINKTSRKYYTKQVIDYLLVGDFKKAKIELQCGCKSIPEKQAYRLVQVVGSLCDVDGFYNNKELATDFLNMFDRSA